MPDAIGLELTARERVIVDEIRAIVGLRSDADVLRTALYRFAEFLEVGVAIGDFALAGERAPRRRRVRGAE